MDLYAAIGLGNALAQGANSILPTFRREEEYQQQKTEHAEDRNWLLQQRNQELRRQQDMASLEDAQMEDALGRLAEAAQRTPPSEALEEWHGHYMGSAARPATDAAPAESMGLELIPSPAQQAQPSPVERSPIAVSPASTGGVNLMKAGKGGSPVLASTPAASSGVKQSSAQVRAQDPNYQAGVGGRAIPPTKQTLGQFGNDVALARTAKALDGHYMSLQGRASQILKQYQDELASAKDDPTAMRSAKVKAMRRYQGLETRLQEITERMENVHSAMAAADFAMKQKGAFQQFMMISGQPNSPERVAFIKDYLTRFGDVAQNMGMTPENLNAIEVKPIPDGDGPGIFFPNGEVMSVKDYAAWQAGLMPLGELISNADKLKQAQMKSREEMNRRDNETRRYGMDLMASTRLAVAASGGGRKEDATDKYERLNDELASMKAEAAKKGWLSSDGNQIVVPANGTPAEKQEATILRDRAMRKWDVIQASQAFVSRRKTDLQEEALNEKQVRYLQGAKERIIKLKSYRVDKNGQKIPDFQAKATQEAVADLQKLYGMTEDAAKQHLTQAVGAKRSAEQVVK